MLVIRVGRGRGTRAGAGLKDDASEVALSSNTRYGNLIVDTC